MSGELQTHFYPEKHPPLSPPYTVEDFWSDDFTKVHPDFLLAFQDIQTWFITGWEPAAYRAVPSYSDPQLNLVLKSDAPITFTRGLFRRNTYLDVFANLKDSNPPSIYTTDSNGMVRNHERFPDQVGPFPRRQDILDQHNHRIGLRRVFIMPFELYSNPNHQPAGVFVFSRIRVNLILADLFEEETEMIYRLEAEKKELERKLSELNGIVDPIRSIPNRMHIQNKLRTLPSPFRA